MKHRILLVDDHPLSREGIAAIIQRKTDLEICGQAGSAAEALEMIPVLKPELVLTDINMPGISGIELINRALAFDPDLKMLVISMHDEFTYAELVLRAGGKGYIMKQTELPNIIKAIREVLDGGIYVSDKIKPRLAQFAVVRRSPLGPLSRRELEVFHLIGNAQTTQQIAVELEISPRTVDAHRAKIKQKLRLKGANDLIRYAQRWSDLGECP